MKRNLILALAFMFMLPLVAQAQDVPGQTKFPVEVESSTTLFEVADNARTTLTSPLTSSATTATVTSTSLFPNSGAVAIGTETVYYTGKTVSTLTGLLRGRDGTSAVAHNAGESVRMAQFAAIHKAVRDSLIATQNKLGGGACLADNGLVLIGTGPNASCWRKLVASDFSNPMTFDDFTADTATINRLTATTIDTPNNFTAGNSIVVGNSITATTGTFSGQVTATQFNGRVTNASLPADITIPGDFHGRNIFGNLAGATGLPTGPAPGMNSTGALTFQMNSDGLGADAAVGFLDGLVSVFHYNSLEKFRFESEVRLPVIDCGGEKWNVKCFGATPDAQDIIGSITAGTSTVTIESGIFNFTVDSVGRILSLPEAGAGHDALIAPITVYNSPTSVNIGATASFTVTDKQGVYGTDNITAFNATRDAMVAATFGGGATMYVPAGYYLTTARFELADGMTLEGAGGERPHAYGFTKAHNGVSVIRLAATNTAALFMGDYLTDVRIAHIGAKGVSTSGTRGLLAQGYFPRSSFGHKFEDVSFEGFERCVDVQGHDTETVITPETGEWQWDRVGFSGIYTNCHDGIWLNTQNADQIVIRDSTFSIPFGGDAVHAERAGDITITGSQGVGSYSDGTNGYGNTLVYSGPAQSGILVQNSFCEPCIRTFDTQDGVGGNTAYPVTYIHTPFAARLRHNVALVSLSNTYQEGIAYFIQSGSSTGSTLVSIGDRVASTSTPGQSVCDPTPFSGITLLAKIGSGCDDTITGPLTVKGHIGAGQASPTDAVLTTGLTGTEENNGGVHQRAKGTNPAIYYEFGRNPATGIWFINGIGQGIDNTGVETNGQMRSARFTLTTGGIFTSQAGAPSGGCSVGFNFDTATGKGYLCKSGAWKEITTAP